MKIEFCYLCMLLLAAAVLAIPAASHAGVFISVGIAPPPLPVYAQPAIPAPGYMWTPGYWAWGPGGYYWVPGTWVQPPQVGVLWTPGYWGWGGGVYAFHAGYWGPHIGFASGGVNYGYGYGGVGYEGGYWNHGQFAYNRSVNNISNVHVTNVYNKTVVNNVTVNRTSFNGGTGGIQAQPTAQEQAAVRENHIQQTREQEQHVNQAQSNPQLRAAENGGANWRSRQPQRPGEFKSAVAARQAEAVRYRYRDPRYKGPQRMAVNSCPVYGSGRQPPSCGTPDNGEQPRAECKTGFVRPNALYPERPTPGAKAGSVAAMSRSETAEPGSPSPLRLRDLNPRPSQRRLSGLNRQPSPLRLSVLNQQPSPRRQSGSKASFNSEGPGGIPPRPAVEMVSLKAHPCSITAEA